VVDLTAVVEGEGGCAVALVVAGFTESTTEAVAIPHPPLGRLVFQPAASGPEHHGIAPPVPDELDELLLLSVEGEPKIAKSEKLVVVQLTVFAEVSTVQLLNSVQSES